MDSAAARAAKAVKLWILGMLGLALLALAYFERTGASAGTTDSGAGAYRLRLAHAALASGSAPRRDLSLDAAGEGKLPWPALVHAGAARVARFAAGSSAQFSERASLLEQIARGSSPIAGVLAVACLIFLVWTVSPPRFAAEGALLASAILAASRTASAHDAWGRFSELPWLACLGLAHGAAIAWMLRAKQQADELLAAMCAGGLAALALCTSGAGALVLLAGAAALIPDMFARDESSRARSSMLLWLLTALTVASLGGALGFAVRPLEWPRSEHGGLNLGRGVELGVALGCLLLLGRNALGRPLRALSALTLVAAFPAALVGWCPELLHGCAAALLGASLAQRLDRGPNGRQVALGFAGIAALALVFVPPGNESDAPWKANAERTELVRWALLHTPSCAPRLEPASQPSWRVLVVPQDAPGWIGETERAVVGSSFKALRENEGALRAQEIFALTEPDAQLAALNAHRVQAIALGPSARKAPELEAARSQPDSLLSRLLDRREVPSFLEPWGPSESWDLPDASWHLWRVQP